MFAASTYEEIIAREKQVENLEIVVLLFVKPTSQEALDIIKEFEYIYYNSNFAHRFCLCTLKIQYLAVIQLSKVCCYAA